MIQMIVTVFDFNWVFLLSVYSNFRCPQLHTRFYRNFLKIDKYFKNRLNHIVLVIINLIMELL